MNPAVVFLGPSLPLEQARRIVQADFRPPARMGDLYRAVSEGARVIALIDGIFERVPAVWHKEILYALHQGVAVYGAASMGALRAAELHTFGMIGVGVAFRQFADGTLVDDDEVAVAHGSGEDNYRVTSTAMINIRQGLAAAYDVGLLDEAACAALVESSKRRFYPERSWSAVLEDAVGLGVAPDVWQALARWLQDVSPDQKRDDALAALQALLERPADAPATQVDFQFQHTVYWEAVECYCSLVSAQAGAASFERLRNHVRLFEPGRERLVDSALLLGLVEAECRRLRLPPPEDRVALTAFRAKRGLGTSAALADWLQRQRLSREECLRLARLEAMKGQLRHRYLHAVDARLADALKLDAVYQDIADRVSHKWTQMSALQIGQLDSGDVGDADAVMEWYQAVHGKVLGSFDAYVNGLGIGSVQQWREEVFAEYLAVHAAAV
ncbi:TfuA-like protein [Xanthomonas sp. MUS 060]|uniref:TfuA-like protein n=1 Tax=Xanthomonas sp. MUS 060 TaxID=1588031 RepID=UPI0009E20D2E|nr:TfuA-like protein [Xanthomonas sp. MUS 060]